MSGYTKDHPWEVFGDPQDHPGIEAGKFSIVVYGEPHEINAGIQGKTPEQAWANARLIAAAPELLEALEEIIGDTEFGCHRPAYIKAKLAIKKAKGE